MIPTTLSVRTLQQLKDFLLDHRRAAGVKLLPFFSMVDRRKRMHQEIMEELPGTFPEMLKEYIPYSSDVERMGEFRAPLGDYDRKGPAMLAYTALWQEVKSHF
jgi:cellulose biosynthesis protein BcsQ